MAGHFPALLQKNAGGHIIPCCKEAALGSNNVSMLPGQDIMRGCLTDNTEEGCNSDVSIDARLQMDKRCTCTLSRV